MTDLSHVASTPAPNVAEELMCLGGPLHGSIRPRGAALQFTHMMPANPHAPNPKFLDEQHTYVLSTFEYSPEAKAQFWRHKDLDLARAPQFVMLWFLLERPSLRINAAYSLIKAIETFALHGPVVSSKDILGAIQHVFPRPKPKGGDPQP